MPPKEEPPKKKKGPPELTEEQLVEEIAKTKLRLEALKQTTTIRLEEAAHAKKQELELYAKCTEFEDAYAELSQKRFDIISDFTRQQKSNEDELIKRITLLDSQIIDLKDQNELAALALRETIKEKDHYIALKQREVEEQEKKIREMEEEFTKMLNETQLRMTEKVQNALGRQMRGDGGPSPGRDSGSKTPAAEELAAVGDGGWGDEAA